MTLDPQHRQAAPWAVRKARPPVNFLTPARVEQGVLHCIVAHESANGVPLCAVLLPVVPHDGRWCLATPSGQAIEQPQDHQVITQPASVSGPLPGNGNALALAWPGNCDQALVLLLHEQVEGVGDSGFEDADIELDVVAEIVPPACEDNSALRQAVLRCLQTQPAAALERGIVHRRTDASTASAHEGSPGGGRGFAVASCQYPAGIIDGGIWLQPWSIETKDLGPAERSLWRLADRMRSDPSLAFTALTGDQVYVDATAGLFDASSLRERISVAYASMFNHKGLQRLLRTSGVQVLPMMDDHEVADNWDPAPEDSPEPARSARQAELDTARAAYLSLQRRIWPDPATGPTDPMYSTRTLGGYDFFLADTRADRQGRWIGNWREAHLLGQAQRGCLQQWIAEHAGDVRPAFVASAAMLLPRPLSVCGRPAMALHEDAWCGFPRTLHSVLAWLFDADAHRVVFLSGDEHLSSYARIAIRLKAQPQREVVVHSVHSSALYAPYPFANAQPADFAADETFEFEHADGAGVTRVFECEVTTVFSSMGDGFALVRPQPDGSQWRLTIAFDGQRGVSTHELRLG